MKMTINTDHCILCNVCTVIAPDVFRQAKPKTGGGTITPELYGRVGQLLAIDHNAVADNEELVEVVSYLCPTIADIDRTESCVRLEK